MYYRDARTGSSAARSLDGGGAPTGRSGAPRTSAAWTVWLFFADGDSARTADPTDVDVTNDYDDLASVKVIARPFRGSRDRNVGGGPTKTFEWRYSPRNLAYERNR